jgi:hypothetical protein
VLTDEEILSSPDGGRDAIATLTEHVRRSPDAGVEEQLVRLRHLAFGSLEPVPAHHAGPVEPEGQGVSVLSETRFDDLDVGTLRGALARQGCALVRGLVSPSVAAGLAGDVDRALAAYDASADGSTRAETSPWFAKFTPSSDGHRLGSRRFMRESGGIWTVDSPRMLAKLCELLDSTGVGALATEFLGERPALSALKCNLRRVPVDTNSNWHQDGAFLGTGVRSLNLWLALSDCGVDAPGLDLVPRRFDHLVDTGTEGAIFDWSVAPAVVEREAGPAPVLRPRFSAGDALLFDHMFLHRTGVDPGMTSERYAIECWMFAPSAYPPDQIPVVY